MRLSSHPRLRNLPLAVQKAIDEADALRGGRGLETWVSPLWQPYPDSPQERALASEANITGFGGQAGGGKALALDTPLPTPSGWTTMEEVRVGDSLFDEAGCPCSVIATSGVMRDHDVYDVVFDDGSVIRADAEHRWFTTTYRERDAIFRSTEEWRAQRRAKRPSRSTGRRPDLADRNRWSAAAAILKPPPSGNVRTTLEIARSVRVGKSARANHAIAVAGPLELPEANLPLSPYVLGVWLGDGNSRAARIYVHDSDLETIGELGREGFASHRVPSEPIGWQVEGLHPFLKALGVYGNKHIPEAYLRGSFDQRLDLLRGLMDTDGDCDEDGGATFNTTLAHLAHQVHELARTLGIKATLQTGRAKLNGRDCGPKYRVKMTTALRVFRLARKSDRQPQKTRDTQSRRYIVRVDRVASVPVKCVAVDSPSHLYLAGRAMIPTHNTDWLLGLASTQHRRSIIFRREYSQLDELIERSRDLFGDHGKFNGQKFVWRDLPGDRSVAFGAVQHEGSKRKFQGRARDLIAFDELTHFLESQFWFLIGWLRTGIPGQRSRVACTFNPPTHSDERWVVRLFAPWLDRKHHRPAAPGELRWYARIKGKDVECEDGTPFQHGRETITPLSRTFFPSRLSDNPTYAESGYEAQLQSLPEPLRSQLLYGDFDAGIEDDAWQVIPTKWVEAAMDRWASRRPDVAQTCVGMDVAHGGNAQTVLAPRYGNYFAELRKHPGRETPNGNSAAAFALQVLEKKAYCNVDAIGYGASAQERLAEDHQIDARAINVSAPSQHTDRSGRFKMTNLRAEMYWRLREALDPDGGDDLALPPDPELLRDLTQPTYRIKPSGIQIEPKEDIAKRLDGQSPDCGDAVALAMLPDMEGEWRIY